MLRNGKAARETDKASNRFWLVSMASSADPDQIKSAAELTFLPLLPSMRASLVKTCSQTLGVPGVSSWCPMRLLEISQLTNYYNQRVLDAIYLEGADDPAVDFPNAIYIDAIDTEGRIRTGPELLNPAPALREEPPSAATTEGGGGGGGGGGGSSDVATAGFAYSATLVAANIRRFCRRLAGGASSLAAVAAAAADNGCAAMLQGAEAARQLAPLRLWNDTEKGRRADWPSLPPLRRPSAELTELLV